MPPAPIAGILGRRYFHRLQRVDVRGFRRADLVAVMNRSQDDELRRLLPLLVELADEDTYIGDNNEKQIFLQCHDVIERLCARVRELEAELSGERIQIEKAHHRSREKDKRIDELEERLREKTIYAINCKLGNVDPSESEVNAALFEAQQRIAELEQAQRWIWNQAIRAAMRECTVTVNRGNGEVGARHCYEIRDSLYVHIDNPITPPQQTESEFDKSAQRE